MNCRQVESSLSALQDRELSPEREKVMLQHLSACPACSKNWQELLQLADDLRRLPTTQASENFYTQVMNRLAQHRPPKLRFIPSLAYSLAFLLLSTAGFIGLKALQGGKVAPTSLRLENLLLESQNMQLLQVQDQTMQTIMEKLHETH